MKLLMSPRRNALGWRTQLVLFVGPKTGESGHWSPITVPETEGMWVETDPEILWQQQVDDHVWENTGKPVCLFYEEWSDLFGNMGLTATKMTRNDELPRSCGMDRHSGYFCDHHHFTNSSKGHTKTFTPSNCALQTCVP